MPRILNVKDAAVTVGTLDKTVEHKPDLLEVTFATDDGTPHTIYAHRDGPFSEPEAAVAAWLLGKLHTGSEPVDDPDTPMPPAGPVMP
jgi:hypothetical protein